MFNQHYVSTPSVFFILYPLRGFDPLGVIGQMTTMFDRLWPRDYV